MSELGAATRRREETAPENAQFSTGPTSAEGKAISSMNAVKHGMRSKSIVLRTEDAAAFEALRAALVEEFAPATRREQALVHAIAGWMWKRDRMDRIECEFWERGYQAGPDGQVSETPLADVLCRHGREFSLIMRYSSQASRGLEKAEQELRALQEQRRMAAMQARLNQRALERAAAKAEAESAAAVEVAATEAPAGNSVEAGAAGNRRAGAGLSAAMQQTLAAAGIQLSGGGSAAGAGQKAAPPAMAPARRNSQFIPGRR